MGARAWPSGCLCPGPVCLGCGTRFAQTVLAPPTRSRDRGAASPAGALLGQAREPVPTKDKDTRSLL